MLKSPAMIQKPAPSKDFLISSDFELKLKFKITGGNSGVQYRSKRFDKPDDFHIGGYQADIDGAKKDTYTGILYEERGRGILVEVGQKVVIDDKGYSFALHFRQVPQREPQLRTLQRLVHWELAAIVGILLCATLMARGIGFFG